MKLVTFILLLILALITVRSLFLSFRSQSPSDYAQLGPEFVLKEHLSGRFQSEGLIYGPNGKVTNTFVAVMNAEWDGDTGTMTEDFTYSNGTKQQRIWYMTAGADNTFTATADDIVGKATGVLSGATVMLNYKITLPDDAGGYTLTATDWLYLTQDGVIMNKSEMRKFGIKVAELIATMRRE